jgi:hypothetical protein
MCDHVISGFSTGFNIAEASNFGCGIDWIRHGIYHPACGGGDCAKGYGYTPHINMEPWVEKYFSPVDYKKWLEGNYEGYHPQDLQIGSTYLAAKRGQYNGKYFQLLLRILTVEE